MTCTTHTARMVVVKYSDEPYAKEYNYLTVDYSIKAGDLVLVDSPYSGLVTLKVLRVAYPNSLATKYIVGKVSGKDIQQQNDRSRLKTVTAQYNSRRATVWKRAKIMFIDELIQEDPKGRELLKEKEKLEKRLGIKASLARPSIFDPSDDLGLDPWGNS